MAPTQVEVTNSTVIAAGSSLRTKCKVGSHYASTLAAAFAGPGNYMDQNYNCKFDREKRDWGET